MLLACSRVRAEMTAAAGGGVLKVELWTQDLWAQKIWWLIVERILRGVLRGEGVRVFRTRGWSGQRLSMS